ncbi:hypothetical protein [Frankia sp. AgB32]|uniref:hypothetical protein n=1 Tax=Frankia sp. AgB32 TaxID=631119 RepID=UPI00200D9BC9|nr:hypothetical protein [Frankia sp. AgB32]MCK9894052.1 hypothetical protein [Frankia sp. AgB32]
MLIDCDSCVVRGVRCAGCVVTVMFADAVPRPAAAARGVDASGAPEAEPRWDAQELCALGVLADAGLLPAVGNLAGAVLDRAVLDGTVLDGTVLGPVEPRRRALPPRRAG